MLFNTHKQKGVIILSKCTVRKNLENKNNLSSPFLNVTNDKNEGVSIITCTNRPQNVDIVFANYSRQIFDKKELIIILNNDKMNINKWKERAKLYKNIKIFQYDEKKTLGECKNFAINHVSLKYIAFFDDDDYYGENYLLESINVFNNNECDVVGKSTCFIYFENKNILGIFNPTNENIYVNYVMDSSLVIKRKIFENINFEDDTQPETLFQITCSKKGYKIYSTSKYNYVVHRHLNPTKEHTWKISDINLLRYCEIVKRNINNYTEYVDR